MVSSWIRIEFLQTLSAVVKHSGSFLSASSAFGPRERGFAPRQNVTRQQRYRVRRGAYPRDTRAQGHCMKKIGKTDVGEPKALRASVAPLPASKSHNSRLNRCSEMTTSCQPVGT